MQDTDDFFYFRTKLRILEQRNPQEARAELHARFVSDSNFRNNEGVILTNKITVEDLIFQKEIHINDSIC